MPAGHQIEQDALANTTVEYGVNSGGSLILHAGDVGLRRTGDPDWLAVDPPFDAWSLEYGAESLANTQPSGSDDVPLYLDSRTTTGPVIRIATSQSSTRR